MWLFAFLAISSKRPTATISQPLASPPREARGRLLRRLVEGNVSLVELYSRIDRFHQGLVVLFPGPLQRLAGYFQGLGKLAGFGIGCGQGVQHVWIVRQQLGGLPRERHGLSPIAKPRIRMWKSR